MVLAVEPAAAEPQTLLARPGALGARAACLVVVALAAAVGLPLATLETAVQAVLS